MFSHCSHLSTSIPIRGMEFEESSGYYNFIISAEAKMFRNDNKLQLFATKKVNLIMDFKDSKLLRDVYIKINIPRRRLYR